MSLLVNTTENAPKHAISKQNHFGEGSGYAMPPSFYAPIPTGEGNTINKHLL